MISDYLRRNESREFEPAMTVRSYHHRDLHLLVAESGNATSPFSFDHGSTFKRESKFGKKGNRVIKGLYDDADIIHSEYGRFFRFHRKVIYFNW